MRHQRNIRATSVKRNTTTGREIRSRSTPRNNRITKVKKFPISGRVVARLSLAWRFSRYTESCGHNFSECLSTHKVFLCATNLEKVVTDEWIIFKNFV